MNPGPVRSATGIHPGLLQHCQLVHRKHFRLTANLPSRPSILSKLTSDRIKSRRPPETAGVRDARSVHPTDGTLSVIAIYRQLTGMQSFTKSR